MTKINEMAKCELLKEYDPERIKRLIVLNGASALCNYSSGLEFTLKSLSFSGESDRVILTNCLLYDVDNILAMIDHIADVRHKNGKITSYLVMPDDTGLEGSMSLLKTPECFKLCFGSKEIFLISDKDRCLKNLIEIDSDGKKIFINTLEFRPMAQPSNGGISGIIIRQNGIEYI